MICGWLECVFSLWNYNPDNDDTHGDFWNGENFSWFSKSRAATSLSSEPLSPQLDESSKELDAGARLLSVLVRPYPAKVAGTPMEFSYEPTTGAFKFVYDTSENASLVKARETEIFVPAALVESRKLTVSARGAKWSYDAARQTLFIVHAGAGVRTVQVELDPPLNNHFVKERGRVWIAWVLALLLVVLSWLLKG